MEKYNDTICLVLSQCMFLFTDFVPETDTKYMIGWMFDGLVGLMLGSNLFLITLRGFQLVVNTARKFLTIRRNKRILKAKGIKLRKPKAILR